MWRSWHQSYHQLRSRASCSYLYTQKSYFWVGLHQQAQQTGRQLYKRSDKEGSPEGRLRARARVCECVLQSCPTCQCAIAQSRNQSSGLTEVRENYRGASGCVSVSRLPHIPTTIRGWGFSSRLVVDVDAAGGDWSGAGGHLEPVESTVRTTMDSTGTVDALVKSRDIWVEAPWTQRILSLPCWLWGLFSCRCCPTLSCWSAFCITRRSANRYPAFLL